MGVSTRGGMQSSHLTKAMRTPSAAGSFTSASSHWARGQREGIEFAREEHDHDIRHAALARLLGQILARRHLAFVEEDAHVGAAFQQRGQPLRDGAIGRRVAGKDRWSRSELARQCQSIPEGHQAQRHARIGVQLAD